MTTRATGEERSSGYSGTKGDERTEGQTNYARERTQFNGEGKSDKQAIDEYKSIDKIGVAFDTDEIGKNNKVLRYRMEAGEYKGENLKEADTDQLGYARAMAFTEAMAEKDNQQLTMARQLMESNDFRERHPDDWLERKNRTSDYTQAVNFSKEMVAQGLMNGDEDMVKAGREAMTEYGRTAFADLSYTGDDWRQRAIPETPDPSIDPREKYDDYDSALEDKLREHERYQNDIARYHVNSLTSSMDPETKVEMERKIDNLCREYHGEMLERSSDSTVIVGTQKYLESQATEFKKESQATEFKKESQATEFKKEKKEENENDWRIILAKMLEWMLEHIFLEKVKKQRAKRAPDEKAKSQPDTSATQDENYTPRGGPGQEAAHYGGIRNSEPEAEEPGESFASTQDYGRAIMSLGYNVNHNYSFDAHGAMQEHFDKTDDLRNNEKSSDEIVSELRERIQERTGDIARHPDETKYFNWFDQRAASAAVQEMKLAEEVLNNWQELGIRADEVDEEDFGRFREHYVNGMFLDDMAKKQWTSKAVMETWEEEGFKRSVLEHEEREKEAVAA